MPKLHSTFARREARPFEAEALAADQRRARDGILELLRSMEAGDFQAEGAPSAETTFVAQVDEDRRSQSILVHGERGTGKTSVLLSVLKDVYQRWKPPTRVTRGANTSIGMTLPLPIIDLALIEQGLSLDLLLGARLQQLVEYLHDTAKSRCRTEGDDQPLEDLWDHFVAIAAGQNINEHQLTGTSFQERVEQLRRLAIQGIDRATRFAALIDAIHSAACKRWGINLFLLVTVDDAEVHPDRVVELLRTLRALQHPRLAFLVAGDLRLFQRAMEVKLEKDLPQSKDPYLVPQIAAQGLERVFPQAQRFPVRLLPVAERLALRQIGLREQLKGVRVEAGVGNNAAFDLGSFAEIFDDPLLSRMLPDRLRTLEDWYQALRAALADPALDTIGEKAAHNQPDPNEKESSRKAAIQSARVEAVLRTLWEIQLEHREEDPRARDLLRRRIGLNWISGDRLVLDTRGLKASWGVEPLPDLTVDEADVNPSRRVAYSVPVLQHMTLELVSADGGPGIAHRLSESVALMIFLTLDVGVAMGWCQPASLQRLMPTDSWIEGVVAVDGAVLRFPWPMPTLASMVRHLLPLSIMVRHFSALDDEKSVENLAIVWAHHLSDSQTAWAVRSEALGGVKSFEQSARARKTFAKDTFDLNAAQLNLPHFGRKGRWGEDMIATLSRDLKKANAGQDPELLLRLATAWKIPTTRLASRPLDRGVRALPDDGSKTSIRPRLTATQYRSDLCEAVTAAEWETIFAALQVPGGSDSLQALCAPLSPSQRSSVVQYWLWRNHDLGMSRLTLQADPDPQGNPHTALVELIALIHADMVAEGVMKEAARVPIAIIGKGPPRRRGAAPGPFQSPFPAGCPGTNWPGYLVRLRSAETEIRATRGIPTLEPTGILGVERLVQVWNDCLEQSKRRKDPCDGTIRRWFLSLASLTLLPKAWENTEQLVPKGSIVDWSGVVDEVRMIAPIDVEARLQDRTKGYFVHLFELIAGLANARIERTGNETWGRFLARFEEWLSHKDAFPGDASEAVEKALKAVQDLRKEQVPRE